MWCELNLHAKLNDAHILKLASFFAERELTAANDGEEEQNGDSPPNSADPVARPDSEKVAGVASWNDMEVDLLTDSSSSSLLPRRNPNEARSSWINSCLVASSSNVDVLVFALVQKLVIFERLPDGRMELAAQVEVDHNIDVSQGYISSICVLPVACPGNRKSDTSVYDWTCIAVGLSSGFVNFYSERGVLVFSERISHHPVKSLRFGPSFKRGGQEFAILTENTIVVVEGASLYNTLRTARSQVARGEVTLEEICNSLEVRCHRYDLAGSEGCLDDFLVTGPIKPSSVDQYVAASLSESGCDTKLVRSSLPTYSTYLCVGEAPFSSFAWFDESIDTTNLLSDTFFNLTNQLTTAVTDKVLPSIGFRSFLGIGTSRCDQPQKKIPTDVRSVSIPTRSSLDDGGRCGERVYASPASWNLAAIADASARVLLINIKTRQIIRIWKGYREARCAWIESTGKVPGGTRGKALFLAIFAPRRGLLEVWAMQSGPRVSAFNVDRNGRLVGVGSTSSLLLGKSEHKRIDTLTSAVFISSSGQIHRLSAPFHLALSGNSTASVHDENLLKGITSEREFDESKWRRVVDKMKTVSARRRAVEFLVELPHVDVSVKGKFLESVRDEILAQQRHKKGISVETSLFLAYLNTVMQLLDLFATVAAFEESNESLNIQEESESELNEKLRISPNELSDIMDCINRYVPTERDEGIEMKIQRKYDFVSFLREFSFEHLASSASPVDESEKPNSLWLPQKLKDSSSVSLGQFIFSPVLSGRCSISDFFTSVAPCLGIKKTDLVTGFCTFWLQRASTRPAYYLPHVLSFVENLIEYAVSDGTTEESIARIFDQLISKSTEVCSALILCLVVRAVMKTRMDKGRKQIDEDEAMEATEHWEPLTVDLWDVMRQHLRLLTVLATLPTAGEHSLERLRSTGCGYYREQVGAWAASFMVNPEELYEMLSRPMTNDDHCDIDDFRPSLEEEMKDALSSGKTIEPWKIAIYDLRKHLPVSILWYLVICDCAWECFTHWHRLPGAKPVTLLKNAVKYVRYLNTWPHLQHGIALIAWDTFLREPFRNLYDLLNEKGLQPPDHLIRSEVGVSETELIDFVEVMHDVLQLLCVSVVDLEQIPLPKQEYEDFLVYFVEYSKGGISKVAPPKKTNDKLCLSELVCRKKSVNYHLVLHHIHLALVMQLQITLHARAKPASLFCDIGKRALFESFNCHPLIPLDAVDEHLKNKRQNFALNMVKHITETYVLDEAMNRKLWNVMLDLAREWRLDSDALRRREIELMYKDAYDKQAVHLVPSIIDKGALGSELFKITVSRLKALHDQSGTNLLKEFERYQLGAARTIDLIRHTPDKFATHHEVDWTDLRELASITDELLQAGDGKSPNIRQLRKAIGELINMIEHAKRFI